MNNNFKLDLYKQYRKELTERMIHNDSKVVNIIMSTSILIIIFFVVNSSNLHISNWVWVSLFLPILFTLSHLYLANVNINKTLEISEELIFEEKEFKPDVYYLLSQFCDMLSILFLFVNITLFIYYIQQIH